MNRVTNNKSVLWGLVLFGLAVLGVACTAAHADTFNASKVKCADVPTQLKQAKKDAETATAKASATKAKGSPDAKTATAKAKTANARVKALQKRADSAACKPPAPTTTTIPTADQVMNQATQPGQPLEGLQGKMAIGSQYVNFATNTVEQGTAAFIKDPQQILKTAQQVGAYLQADTDVSRAAKTNVTDAIHKEGFNDEEVNRALSGDGYFPIQVKVAAKVLGTTYFQNGKVLESGEWRKVGPNDVFWLFMTKDHHIVFGATVRADCGNPNLRKIVALKPKENVTPIQQPVCLVSCQPPKVHKPKQPPPCQLNCTPPPISEKPALSRECQQNAVGCPDGFTNPVRQDPQDNSTSGVNTGPTPGAPSSPPPSEAPRPRDNRQDNTPAPDPSPGGSNSGSSNGSGTPSGSTGDSSGNSTGDNNTGPPADSGQGGDNSGMPPQPS